MNSAMLFSPSPRNRQLLPGATGGNLARVLYDAPSASAGLSLFHGGRFRWASRGVQLSRNARSVPACGLLFHDRKTRSPRDSFSEQFEQLTAQFTDTGGCSPVPSPASAPAAPPTVFAFRVPQALPFSEVNYVSHASFYAGNRQSYPLALSANALEKTPYTE
jgi:hypothetical protein